MRRLRHMRLLSYPRLERGRIGNGKPAFASYRHSLFRPGLGRARSGPQESGNRNPAFQYGRVGWLFLWHTTSLNCQSPWQKLSPGKDPVFSAHGIRLCVFSARDFKTAVPSLFFINMKRFRIRTVRPGQPQRTSQLPACRDRAG